ncbi:hypothetical protein D9757_005563 [Collybiopsis confluens]|uniref:Uncharacterized protein n=1 Tax=Collybiopsis confluens TaxID=2823264 RepID=A0A8H5M9G7_9AGAR|nr:hypothetical protein D9757_005563 [Collybiopsis confluens]
MALQYYFVINPFIVISVGALLYGVYLTLFSSSIYLLARRRDANGQRNYHIIALITLFAFATAALILDIIGSAGALILTFEDFEGTVLSAAQLERGAFLLNILEELSLLIYTCANIVADAILIFRLYAVWGFRKRVIIAPLTITVLNNSECYIPRKRRQKFKKDMHGFVCAVLAILDAAIRLKVVMIVDGPEDQVMSESDIFWAENATTMTLAFMIVNLLVNTLVTSLIAGRVWWISRKINASYGNNGSQKKYRRVIAIILESGILYPVAILLALVLLHVLSHCPNLFAILAEVVAIAPTLIIVRVAMGVDVNNEQTVVYSSGGGSSGTERIGEERRIQGQEKLSALRFASRGTRGSSTQFTSVVNLSTVHSGAESRRYREDFV